MPQLETELSSSLLVRRLTIPPSSSGFTVVLGLLAALPALSIDISAPALTSIEAELLSTSRVVGLTITMFMLGFAIGQFACGPLSDRYGRRPLLLIGLACYTASAFACALTASAAALVGWRLLQGVAAGSCAVLAFAIIRDLFEGDLARVKRSYVTVVLGLAPMVAPSLGAILLKWHGWRALYIASFLGGAALLAAAIAGVAESRNSTPPEARSAAHSKPIGTAYADLLRDRRFLGLAAVNALSFGGMFAYIAGAPIVLMDFMSLSATQYSLVFASTAAAMTLGAWASGRCALAGVAAGKLLWFGLMVAVAASVSLSVLLACDACSAAALFGLMLLVMFCRGVVSPNAQHMALEPIIEQAGTAAAAIGVMQILAGAASSAVVALLMSSYGILGATSVMTVLALASALLWSWITLTQQSAPRTKPGP